MMKLLFLFILLAIPLAMASGHSYHVTVSGASSGDGSENSPWNLQTALNHPPAVAAGDTIWLHGGTYKGSFVSTLRGNAGLQVVVRAVPGERVTLDGNGSNGDGVLVFRGEYTSIWGLAITTSNVNRSERRDVVHFLGANNKLINCIISNGGGNGIGFWKTAINSEVYGCIIYHNGYADNDRGHGHGIYLQNETGTKLVRNNIIFNSFGIGIQVYAESIPIRGYTIEGNTFFNCGLPYGRLERHIIVGGLQPADGALVKTNRFYNSPGIESKAMVQFGYSDAVANGSAEFTDNYMVNGSYYCVSDWNTMKVTDNTIIANSTGMQLIAFSGFNIAHPVFNHNDYFKGTLANLTFDEWKNTTGQDAASTYIAGAPEATQYFVSKNEYEDGRAHITVYNWTENSSIEADVSEILAEGDRYALFDASNLATGAIAEGTFNGRNVTIPMDLTDVELPLGATHNQKPAHTAPQFGVFILQRSAQQLGTTTHVATGEAHIREFAAYPNPATDHITVTFRAATNSPFTITVLDAAGRTCISQTLNVSSGWNRHTVSLSSLPAGLYIATVNDGHSRHTVKIQKQ